MIDREMEILRHLAGAAVEFEPVLLEVVTRAADLDW